MLHAAGALLSGTASPATSFTELSQTALNSNEVNSQRSRAHRRQHPPFPPPPQHHDVEGGASSMASGAEYSVQDGVEQIHVCILPGAAGIQTFLTLHPFPPPPPTSRPSQTPKRPQHRINTPSIPDNPALPATSAIASCTTKRPSIASNPPSITSTPPPPQHHSEVGFWTPVWASFHHCGHPFSIRQQDSCWASISGPVRAMGKDLFGHPFRAAFFPEKSIQGLSARNFRAPTFGTITGNLKQARRATLAPQKRVK